MYRLQGEIHIHLSLYATAFFGSIIFDYIHIICIYTLIITLIIHTIDFKYFKSNLHCCILAQITVLIPVLVCMGLGFLA